MAADTRPIGPLARPAARAVASGPLWGLVRLDLVVRRRLGGVLSASAVSRNLSAAEARALAGELLTAADAADAQRRQTRERAAHTQQIFGETRHG